MQDYESGTVCHHKYVKRSVLLISELTNELAILDQHKVSVGGTSLLFLLTFLLMTDDLLIYFLSCSSDPL